MKKQLSAKFKCIIAVFLWVVLWQAAAMLIGEDILLASPWTVCCTLAALVVTPNFWCIIAVSFGRICAGFLLGIAAGVLLAAAAAVFDTVRFLLQPLMTVIRAIPVASFIILVLFWTGSAGLSVVISFLMVLPVVYTQLFQATQQIDMQLSEMARVFHLRWYQKLTAVYLPQVLPQFAAACSVGVGLAFKSGIAAEVIGLPDGTIGERLYQAKIYLSSGELLAWTLVIVLLSVLFDRMIQKALDMLQRRVCV